LCWHNAKKAFGKGPVGGQLGIMRKARWLSHGRVNTPLFFVGAAVRLKSLRGEARAPARSRWSVLLMQCTTKKCLTNKHRPSFVD
jgi:hypothetical protein